MILQKTDFLKLLSLVKVGLDQKSITEFSSQFIFTGEDIVSYNDLVNIFVPFESDFSCRIEAREFYNILQELPEEEFGLALKDNQLFITADNFKATLKTQPVEDSILKQFLVPEKQKISWKKIPSNFIEGLSLVMYTVSQDSAKPVLMNACISENFIYGTDNFRISRFSLSEKMESFLFPIQAVFDLVKLNIVEYYLFDSGVVFKTKEGILFASRLFEGDFPEIDPFFEIEGDSFKLPSKELQKSISLSAILAEGDFITDKKVKLQIENNKILCVGEKELGKIESEVSFKSNDIEASFAIHPDFLHHILDHSTDVIFSDNVLYFHSDNFEHLISLFSKD